MKGFTHIVNQLRSEGEDYTHFKTLLNAIEASKLKISRDEILEFVSNDYRIQLHTTPNTIAKLISLIALKNEPKSAIDICCGTGNILYYLQNEIDDLTGVEIMENVADLTRFFFPKMHIISADSFVYPLSSKYDLVVGNIPFGMRIELDGKRISSEEAFLRKAHELLTENGRAIMLVPYSILMNGSFINFRKAFVSFVEEIISLPSGSIRNTQVKTALLIISKQEIKEVAITQLTKFDSLEKEYLNSTKIIYPIEKLSDRWDLEFYQNKESSFYRELENFQTKDLKDLAEIIKGKKIPVEKLKEKGDFLYLLPTHIQNNKLNIEKAIKYVSKEYLSEKVYGYLLQPGDIVIGSLINGLNMYIYQKTDVPAFASFNLTIIRSSKQDYILSYLQTVEGQKVFKKQAEDLKIGFFASYLSSKEISKIKIPILPIANLNSLGDACINRSTETQLRDALDQLNEYKNQILELKKEKENLSQLKAFIDNRFNRVESQLELVNKKLDDLMSILMELKTDFEQIQNLPREEEEKLFKLCQKIDSKLDIVYNKEHQTIEGYIEEIKRWLNLWELLDLQSQKFLPIAEFIFDELSKLEDADYAPFVVQYCRTLENEILRKLFEAYHSTGLKNVNIDELVKNDLENKTTGKFAQMVKKNKITYTLGDMNFIMALLKHGGKNLNDSPLLQNFRAFTISYFDKKIVEAEFLKDVNKLTNDFRNKAAHPYSINIALAKECQSLLRKSLNVFLESVKETKI